MIASRQGNYIRVSLFRQCDFENMDIKKWLRQISVMLIGLGEIRTQRSQHLRLSPQPFCRRIIGFICNELEGQSRELTDPVEHLSHDAGHTAGLGILIFNRIPS